MRSNALRLAYRPVSRSAPLALLLLAACIADMDDEPDPSTAADPAPPDPEAGGELALGGPAGALARVDVCATGSAYRTITAGLAAVAPGGLVSVCPGVYRERLTIDRKPVSIVAAQNASNTILDGGGGGTAVRIVGTAGAGVVLQGLTIRNGATAIEGGAVRCEQSVVKLIASVVSGSRGDRGGGGLYATACTLTVSKTRFQGNQGGPRGGGALLVKSAGEVADSVFVSNQATQGGGIGLVEGSVALRRNQLGSNKAGLNGGAVYSDSNSLIESNVITSNDAGWTGGGLYISMHAPVIRRNDVRRNHSVNDGGGIYTHISQVVLTDNVFAENRSDDDGGGIRLFESTGRLERNRVERNTAADSGAGIRISHEQAVLIDNVIVGNVAGGIGGGIDMDNDASIVRGGSITGNRASAGGGISGGLFPWLGATIENVRIADNVAHQGGGLYLFDNYQALAVRRVVFSGNLADLGGAVYATTTNVTISNSTFTGNVAYQSGGALHVAPADAWPGPCPCPPATWMATVRFSVIHGNRAPAGAAVWTGVGSFTAVEGSILSGNDGMTATVVGDAPPRWRYNDSFPAAFAGMLDPSGADGNLAVDPRYVAPAAGNFRLAAGSPCIDAADPAIRDRNGSRADMGAYGGPEAP